LLEMLNPLLERALAELTLSLQIDGETGPF
jgi:hypothetical protein